MTRRLVLTVLAGAVGVAWFVAVDRLGHTATTTPRLLVAGPLVAVAALALLQRNP